MIASILFYVFAALLVGSAAVVVSVRNPVHSVLFLILAFFNAAALFLLVGAEFLAMILVIVYVGAVAVLFLFVVMMLDIDFAELRSGFQRYLPVGLAVGAVLLVELVLVIGGWKVAPEAATLRFAPRAVELHNTAAARPPALHRLHLPVPGRRAGAAGGDDRRHRADAARPCRCRDGRTSAARSPGMPGDTLELLDVPSRAGIATLGILRPRPPEPKPAKEHARRRRAPLMAVGLFHYLIVAALLLVIGIFGIFLNRKNVIIILMSIELILLAVNLNLVAFAASLDDMVGQVFVMFMLTVAAAEAAIGLAIVVVYFRNRGSIQVEDVNLMKG